MICAFALSLTLAACGGAVNPAPAPAPAPTVTDDAGTLAPAPGMYCYTDSPYLLLCAPEAHEGDACTTPYGNGVCGEGTGQ